MCKDKPVAVVPDSIVPLDHVLNVEVAGAASKLTRKEANPVVLKLLDRYESELKSPPRGVTYQDCYDMVTGELTNAEYAANADRVRKEIQNMGLPVEKSI